MEITFFSGLVAITTLIFIGQAVITLLCFRNTITWMSIQFAELSKQEAQTNERLGLVLEMMKEAKMRSEILSSSDKR